MELVQKKEEVKNFHVQLNRANEKIVDLETKLNYEETQRNYMNSQLKKDNSLLV